MKTIKLISLFVLCAVACMAQQQKGYVHTTESKTSKSQPLSGVYITLDGSYNESRSNENGSIELYMPDKKNGDPFKIKKIHKPGYVLTDKYLLRQEMAVSSKVRVDIAMKSESEIRKERADYSHSITSATNERWYQKEKSLNDLLDKKQITIENYEKEIDALNRAKESFGQMISYMADFCASIDYSKISENQRKVLDLLNAGDIEGADRILNIDSISDDEKIAKIKKHRAEVQSIRRKADELLSATERAEETLQIEIDAVKNDFCLKAQVAYQKGEFDVSASYYSKAADVDSTDVDRQIDAALLNLIYSNDTILYNKYLAIAKQHTLSKEDRFKCMEAEYLYYLIYGRYVEAGIISVSMIELFADTSKIELVEIETVEVDPEIAAELETGDSTWIKSSPIYVGELYNQWTSAIIYAKYDLVDVLELTSLQDSISCSKAMAYLSTCCQLAGKNKDMEMFLLGSMYLMPDIGNEETSVVIYFNCLSALIRNGGYKEALELCSVAVISDDHQLTKDEQNWNAIIRMYASICRAGMKQSKFDDIEFLKDGLSAYTEYGYSQKSLLYVELEANIIAIYMSLRQYNKAIAEAKRIKTKIETITETLPAAVQYLLANNTGTCYYYLKDYSNALDEFIKLQTFLESKEAIDAFGGFNNGVYQSLNFYNIAQNYKELGDTTNAVVYHEKTLSIRKDLYSDENSNWLVESYTSMIPLYSDLQQFDRALELADEYLDCSKEDSILFYQAQYCKYDVLLKRMISFNKSKKAKKELVNYLKDKELAFWDRYNNVIYTFLDISIYEGVSNSLWNNIVLSPNGDVYKLGEAPNIKSGKILLMNSDAALIRKHKKIYKTLIPQHYSLTLFISA